MSGSSRFLRALAGIAGVAASLTVGAGLPLLVAPAAHADDDTTSSATVRAADDSPLKVTIDDLAPSYLPATGAIVVSGEVTNRDSVTWTNIHLYTFAGAKAAPIVNAAQLAKAAATPYDAVVGDRITTAGKPGIIDSLAPGQTASYTVTVPASAIDVHQAGVYWFGVHALGASPQGQDQLADGRARTFLPYVPRRITATLPTSLVVPLTRPVTYAADGSLADASAWARSLSPQGRLYDAVAFGGSSTVGPVTWLVDPALVDAVAHLATGNQPRSLDQASAPTSGASPSAPPTGGATGATASPASLDQRTAQAASAASTWLQQLRTATTGDQVLALPYGNLDVPAALAHADQLVGIATAQKSAELAALGIDTRPALASPGGYLDRATIQAAGPDTTVLASDRMFAGPSPGVVTVDGHRVVVASSGAAAGGPGPGPAMTSVALRQRILSEAAVRLLKRDPVPLTVVLPTRWHLTMPGSFFSGLVTPWLDLQPVSQLSADTTPKTVDGGALAYPALQQRRQLDADTIAGVQSLIRSSGTLQNLLSGPSAPTASTGTTGVGATLVREALTGASYAVRNYQALGRATVSASRLWVQSKLQGVAISAPRGVTLSSGSGKFAATLTNHLDQRVTVGVRAHSDSGLVIDAPAPVQIDPHSHSTVILEAHATTNKVHNVTLVVTDRTGAPLGATDQLPIRSAQVSAVIWLIMGTGAALLFGTIAVRLARRIARARRDLRSA